MTPSETLRAFSEASSCPDNVRAAIIVVVRSNEKLRDNVEARKRAHEVDKRRWKRQRADLRRRVALMLAKMEAALDDEISQPDIADTPQR